jgi:hypothetical protein
MGKHPSSLTSSPANLHGAQLYVGSMSNTCRKLTSFQAADIHSKHGVILSCHLSSDDVNQTWCKELGDSLVGAKYASLEGIRGEDQFDSPQQTLDILEWLREEM